MSVRSCARRPFAVVALAGLLGAAPARGRADEPAAPAAPSRPTPAVAVPTRPAVTKADLEARVRFLSSDAMAGRFSTDAGGRAASQYVADEFARLGLEPKGDDGWFQPFAIPIPVLGAGNALEVRRGDGTDALAVETAWNPLSFSANQEASGPLVFAGYGVEHPEKGYDDFAGLDVKGKVLLVLRREPPWAGGPSSHATFLAKLAEATKRGAVALLVANDPRSRGKVPDVPISFAGGLGAPPGSATIPVAFLTEAAADRLLAPLATSLAALQRSIDGADGGPKAGVSADVPGTTVRLRVAIERTKGPNARNVCGLLRGRDPALAHEVVVVGAHHDHVGRGQVGSAGGPADVGKIHPGADDNASGTAALLELAEALSTAEPRPRRSVLFLSFSGEELGLLGSVHYVNHPTMPLSDISVMVNCDMVGRYDPKRKLEIGGVGTGDGLQGIVEAANAPYGLALAWDPSGVAPSDNTSFFRKRVPVLFFFTGVHAEYHTPRDTPDTLDYAGAEQVVGVCLGTVRTLADRDAKIEFRVPPVDAAGRKAALGIQPATGSDSGGVVVAGVADGGAAATAGLREGDVIVAIGPYLVDGLRDLSKALTTMKPGDKVLVKVVRGTDHLAVDVVLGSRR